MIALRIIALTAALAGCAALDEPERGPWLLPPTAPPVRADPPAADRSAVAVVPSAGLTWSPPGALSLAQVFASVEATYPLLDVARQEVIVARARQLAALGPWDLRLGGDAQWNALGFYENHSVDVFLEQRTGLWGTRVLGGYRLGIGDFDPTFDGKRVTNHGGEFRGGLSVPLFQGGSIDLERRDLYRSEVARQGAEVELATFRLSYFQAAAETYWSWVAAGRRLDVVTSLLGFAEERQEGIQARADRGDLPLLEAVDNQRLVVSRRLAVVDARRALEQAGIGLSLFHRSPAGEPLRPDPGSLPAALPEPSAPRPEGVAADLDLALQLRPELRGLELEARGLGIDLDYAENLRLPLLDAFVIASQDLDGNSPSRTKGEFELITGLELAFPIQQRGARGQIAAARAALGKLTAQQRYAADVVRAEVADALSALQAAYERVEQASEGAELADRLAQAERRAFELGESTILTLNLREQAAAEAQLLVVDAEAAYWQAVAAYLAAVGVFAAPPGD